MNLLEINHMKKGFDGLGVLEDISLSVKEGEVVSVIGPSGSGKSTLLRCATMLEKMDGGELKYLGEAAAWEENGKCVYAGKQKKKEIRKHFGLVFQNFNLFPHYTVLKNITDAPVSVDKVPKKEAEERAVKLLRQLGLEDKKDAYPYQLSGGQQQRVALARALVVEPSVLLFDEPLSNLDAKLRVSMRTEIRNIQQRVGITAVYVTHDQSEAMALSDRIIIMNKGVVAQVGTPQEIYYRPKNAFVANFIGEANFLKGRLVSKEGNRGVMRIYDHKVDVENVEEFAQDESCTLVLRPESATLDAEGQLPGEVIMSCFMGSYQHYHVKVGDVVVQITDFNPRYKRIFQVGEKAYVKFHACDSHLLKE